MNTTSFILSEITYKKVEDDYSIESDIPSDYTEVDEEKDDSELKNITSIILISDKAQKAKKELQKVEPKKKAILTELITESGWKEFGEPILKNWKKEYKLETMPLKSDRIMTELDVFEKFFDDTFFEHLKEETNRYYNQTAAKKDKLGRLEYWKDVSINELKLFFGIILWMGVLVLPTIEHYFTKHPFFRNDFIQNLMSGRRFTNILAMLHLTDNAKNISNQDKIWKIRPIIKHFREKWRSLFQLGENIVIDESIASYKGRLGFKQYAKDKKKKWGVKFWVLADCESGYIYNIKCYTGKNLVNKGKKTFRSML